MQATVADAWSLAPIGELRLGERVFPVPPLTFGRFQRLIGAEPEKIAAALVVETPPARRTLAERGMDRALRWSILHTPRLTRWLWRVVDLFGLGVRHVPVPEAARWVAICVPGVTEADWRKHGTQRHVAQLFLVFGRAHDWGFIADAIRLGEPLDDGEQLPSLTEITAGLVAVGKATGYTIEALTEMRLDGFYRLVDALREQRAPEPGGELPLGIEYADQTDGSRLLDLLAKAEEAGRGN